MASRSRMAAAASARVSSAVTRACSISSPARLRDEIAPGRSGSPTSLLLMSSFQRRRLDIVENGIKQRMVRPTHFRNRT